MRYAFLIAWREFLENARTRGFWVSLFLFPALWVLAGQATSFLEKKSTPTRHFVLVDASGQLEGVVTNALFRNEQQRVLDALREHLREFRREADDDPGSFTADETRQLLATGETAPVVAARTARLRTNAPAFVPPPPRFQRVPLPSDVMATDSATNLNRTLRPYLRGQRTPDAAGRPVKLFAAVLIPPGAVRLPSGTNSPPAPIEYWCENQADTTLRTEVEAAVNRELRRRQYVAEGIDYRIVQRIEGERAPVATFNPKKAAGRERVGLADQVRQWAPVAFMYLLWVSIFAVAQMLLNSVIEEKSNRIIEVLLSSVTPGELMAGKLLGIALTGLTMVGVWVASLAGVLFALMLQAGASAPALAAATAARAGTAATAVPEPARLPEALLSVMQGTWLVPAFVGYFLLGYLLYASLILAIGSTCNTLKEAQNYMGAIMLVLMVPLFAMPFIPRDPNGTVATVLSWIPLYTPFIMMMRVTADPPWFDVVGTLVLLAGFIALTLWACARIFRIGILRTGQPPRLLELLRWLRR